MTDDQSNATELADRLDNALPPGRNNPIVAADDPSVVAALRLANAPYLSLAVDKKAQILTQVLAAHQQAYPPRRPYRIPPKTPFLLAVVTGLIVIASVLLLVIIPALDSGSNGQGDDPLVDPLTATAETTAIPIPTEIGTEIPLETTALAQPEITETPDPQATPAEIVIVGPVAAIRDNVIVIYDFEFILAPNDPLLTAIQLEDVVRIEGDIAEQGSSFVIIAINVTVISTDIYITGDGTVWRDSNNCQNPPPPQAPAHGWRARCEGVSGSGSRS